MGAEIRVRLLFLTIYSFRVARGPRDTKSPPDTTKAPPLIGNVLRCNSRKFVKQPNDVFRTLIKDGLLSVLSSRIEDGLLSVLNIPFGGFAPPRADNTLISKALNNSKVTPTSAVGPHVDIVVT